MGTWGLFLCFVFYLKHRNRPSVFSVEDKVDDVKFFVEDKVDDVKYFVSEKADDMKYFVSAQLQDQLKFFAECFERIHNRPTYGIKEANGLISFDEGFDTPVLMADFARFDEYRQAVESVQSNV
ncbi:MAG: hypothetical protein ACQEW2_12105 [Bacillota bacterium]|uniref:hypothetical protein n=1 Tax=Cytobacillus firmus TaxID=1399 RepID=UPI00077C3452|nr:hypothetical protein [Cytobacillus firmus]MEC1894292.1 hypothetical protein [Cytobacillus firmus]MED4448773.1 hypothetical protein [Cytobacillus firmus]MED4768425.1 hypothetical protein [Cytobacillus firmus]SUV10549.1 Uncharacterised protein [Cytobacillus firmus]